MQLANERTRLHLDGVRSPITADVTRRREDGMVVTQRLPFLKLDTTVTERGRRSRIRRVTIAMDGDTPQLLLELAHDGSALEDDTLESFTPGVSTRPARTDSTVPYEFAASDEPQAPIVLSDPPPPPAALAPAPIAMAAPRSWWSRAWQRFAILLAQLTARAWS